MTYVGVLAQFIVSGDVRCCAHARRRQAGHEVASLSSTLLAVISLQNQAFATFNADRRAVRNMIAISGRSLIDLFE
jgi:hypothetical protein